MKRGRGRPKGSKNKPKDPNAEPPVKVPKKRGRPVRLFLELSPSFLPGATMSVTLISLDYRYTLPYLFAGLFFEYSVY